MKDEILRTHKVVITDIISTSLERFLLGVGFERVFDQSQGGPSFHTLTPSISIQAMLVIILWDIEWEKTG